MSLGSGHEGLELCEAPRLQRMIRPLLVADRRGRRGAVVVARADDQGGVHLADPVEQGVVHLLDIGPREINTTAVPTEHTLPGAHAPSHDEPAGVRGSSRGGYALDPDGHEGEG